MKRKHIRCGVSAILCWAVLSGCSEEGRRPPPPPGPQDKPAATTAEQTPAVPVPEPSPPADPFHLRIEVQRAEDPQAGWARIDELFNADAGATIDSRWTGPNRIILESTNVRRLSFDLGELPVDRRRSVAFRLAGQAIEVSR